MEEVISRVQTVDAECLPKQFFDAEWEISKDIDINTIHIGDYVPSFAQRNDIVDDPTAEWDVIVRDGTELKDLECAVKHMLSNAQAMDYYGAHEMKMKIRFEANLGEIWLELIDTATGEIISSYARVAETVAARCSGIYSKILAENDDEFYDLPILVHANVVMRSVRTESDTRKLSTHISTNATYVRFFTIKKDEIETILATFLSNQNRDRIKELSNDELNLLLKARNRRMLPLSIKDLRYIGDGQPRFVLDELVVPFPSDTATKETDLASVLFGKKKNLSKEITFEEIFEALDGREWMDLSSSERKAFIRDCGQRVRQLNQKLGAMFGTGATKVIASTKTGIVIDHSLLPN